MNNDIFGLDVAGLHFIANNFTLNGNTLLISGNIDGDPDHVTKQSFTVNINCDLSFPVGGGITAATGDGTLFQSTEEVDLNGHIQVVSGTLGLYAYSYATSSVGGSNGKIYVHNQIIMARAACFRMRLRTRATSASCNLTAAPPIPFPAACSC